MMMSEPVIRVQHISKSFKIFYDKGYSLKERVLFRKRNRYENRRVLSDISFDVMQGEAVGLIGHNGCGKSTMLKLLTRIIYPDSGSVEIKGRVSALIELGAGFHPDMSGKENIYTNAAIFGLSKQEIDERLQTIIDFSELGEYINNPVRTYSSGMYMRLAFSVAINVDADVLLIDEILAVGDAAFQAKCFNKLREIKAKGTTIVIVSHSLGQIEQICDRSIWIDGGGIRLEGKPRDVHEEYLHYMAERSGKAISEPRAETQPEEKEEQPPIEEVKQPEKEHPNRWGSGDIQISSVKLLDKEGNEKNKFQCGEPMQIKIGYKVNHARDDAVFGVGIFRNDGVQCYGTNTDIDRIQVGKLSQDGSVSFVTRFNALLQGAYCLDVAVHRPDGFAYDYIKNYCEFDVYSLYADAGVMRLEHQWKIG